MNYIIFVLEATCDKKPNVFLNETIEIGAVKINDKKEIVDTFSIFIKPKLNPILTDFCKELTTISQKDVDAAYKFPVVLEKFKKWIGDEPYILCSWGFYDKKQFENDQKLWNMENLWNFKHISLKHQFGAFMNIKPCGMQKALNILKLSLKGTHHRGIDDAKNIAQIFINCFERWDFK